MFHKTLPILILQHPKEPGRKDQEISSVNLLEPLISPFCIKTGLSWRNLESAAKTLITSEELSKPSNWVTLYLGTKKQGEFHSQIAPGIYHLDKKGNPLTSLPSQKKLGLILLDGTWSQAKTLWWRNAWLLKTQRIYLVPKEKSKYGSHRKEPRPECVSTLEALAESLSFMGYPEQIETDLKSAFQNVLKDFSLKK